MTTRTKRSTAATKARKPTVKVDAGYKFDYSGTLDTIEKKYKLTNSMTDRFAYGSSSGLLVVDLLMGGGFIGGGMYTVAGEEQSAKSTFIMNFLSAQLADSRGAKVISYADAEGSFEPKYFGQMMKAHNLKLKDTEIFGVKSPSGGYIVPPRIRYYTENRGEIIMESIASVLRRLPDRELLDGQWYYVFENTKENQKKLKGKYSAKLFSTHNKFYVPSEYDGMQAIFVVDSWPSLVTERADDEDSNGTGLGANARMFAEKIPMIKGKLRRKDAILIGINQLREKPMHRGDPRYEPCFVGSTPVLLADGTTDTIRNIVEDKRDVEVLSFDPETGEISAKRIIDWKDNGLKSVYDMVTVVYRAHGPYGSIENQVTCTKDHEFWTPDGWVKAGDLTQGSLVCLAAPSAKPHLDPETRKPVFGDTLLASSVVEVRVPTHLYADTAVRVYDLTVEDNHTYFVGGSTDIKYISALQKDSLRDDRILRADCVAVSNCGSALRYQSDVRMWNTPRAVPHGSGGPIEEEPSVLGEGTDTYRYIHHKMKKNKLSTPYLEGWSRLWVSDHKGAAHGYDIVWDTYQFLKVTGQCSGLRKKLVVPMLGIKTPLTWEDFKGLILLKGTALQALCKKLKLTSNPKLREKCFTQMRSGKAIELYFAHLHGGEDE